MDIPIEKLSTDRYSGRIARQIQELVVSSQLVPGDKLPPERELAARYGVSRTAVREALKLLQERGFIEARTGSGSFVAKPGIASVTSSISLVSQMRRGTLGDLLEARLCLEGYISRLAVERATEDDIAVIEDTVSAMRRALSEDPHRYIDIDLDFHTALASASHNPFFVILSASLIDLIQSVRRVSVGVPGSMARAQAFHEGILACLKSRDAPRAQKLVADHLEQFRQDLEAAGLKNAHEFQLPGVSAGREASW
jgi:GntR family transcriptional repressor for pyruvate dehydrogenase complex